MRWPAGFVGPALSDLQSGDTVNDHDPFDPMRQDFGKSGSPTGFALYPLIYSAGNDRFYDIDLGYGYTASPYGVAASFYDSTGTSSQGNVSPYVASNSTQNNNGGLNTYIGQPLIVTTTQEPVDPNVTANHTRLGNFDNIHNHRLEVR